MFLWQNLPGFPPPFFNLSLFIFEATVIKAAANNIRLEAGSMTKTRKKWPLGREGQISLGKRGEREGKKKGWCRKVGIQGFHMFSAQLQKMTLENYLAFILKNPQGFRCQGCKVASVSSEKLDGLVQRSKW